MTDSRIPFACGSLEGTAESVMTATVLEDGHWFDVYDDVQLDCGEKIGQVSVEYDLLDTHHHKPRVSFYFETAEGGMHVITDALRRTQPKSSPIKP